VRSTSPRRVCRVARRERDGDSTGGQGEEKKKKKK
jgi:hypothetical protein